MATSTDVETPPENHSGGRLRSWMLEGLSDMAKTPAGAARPAPEPSTGASAGGG